MSVFRLRHATSYRFSSPVELGPHQLYLRPRGDHRLKVMTARLTLSPPGEVIWRNDLYGNSVALARFEGTASALDIVSELELETFPRSERQRSALFELGAMFYSELESRLLFAFIDIPTAARTATQAWMNEVSAQTLSPYERLLACASAVRAAFVYRPRFEAGLQTPETTLALRSGTCRDFAELMIAAARTLGFAGRFVTGYVFTPNARPDSSSPHAWAEIYIPAIGWIELDPTNGLVDDGDLIPVASASSGAELTPVAGSFHGAGARAEMTVSVEINRAG